MIITFGHMTITFGHMTHSMVTQPPVLFSSHMQHYTFYDFITNKARGKSGPLFSFDVHEDVRLLNDAAVEKDEVRDGWLF